MRAALVFALLAGCGGTEPGFGPFAPDPSLSWGPAATTLFSPLPFDLSGDWFFCRDGRVACERVDNDGLRLEPDGELTALETKRSRDPDELEYCPAGRVGRWSFDGQSRLSLRSKDGSTSVVVHSARGRLFWSSPGTSDRVGVPNGLVSSPQRFEVRRFDLGEREGDCGPFALDPPRVICVTSDPTHCE